MIQNLSQIIELIPCDECDDSDGEMKVYGPDIATKTLKGNLPWRACPRCSGKRKILKWKYNIVSL